MNTLVVSGYVKTNTGSIEEHQEHLDKTIIQKGGLRRLRDLVVNDSYYYINIQLIHYNGEMHKIEMYVSNEAFENLEEFLRN